MTLQTKKDELIACLIKEIKLRKEELNNSIIETIYFGGGTPSVLSTKEIETLIDAVYQNHKVVHILQLLCVLVLLRLTVLIEFFHNGYYLIMLYHRLFFL